MVHEILMRLFAHATLYRMALARAYGLNLFQLLSVLLIGSSQPGSSIKGLRKALSIPGSSLTFTLDSLEKKGLVLRSRDKRDRRQWLLTLTPKGERLYFSILERQRDAIMPALEKFPDSEKEAFLKIADAIGRNGALLGMNLKITKEGRLPLPS